MAKEEREGGLGLGWIEWAWGWRSIVAEFLFQRIVASRVENPLLMPPMDGATCVVTGCTSGISMETTRQLAESGAHVVIAVRRPKSARDLIQKWQSEMGDLGILLNIEVMELDLLSLESVAKFAKAFNARQAPLYALINNAGIFSIGEPQKFFKDGYERHLQVNHLSPALLGGCFLFLPFSEALQVVSSMSILLCILWGMLTQRT